MTKETNNKQEIICELGQRKIHQHGVIAGVLQHEGHDKLLRSVNDRYTIEAVPPTEGPPQELSECPAGSGSPLRSTLSTIGKRKSVGESNNASGWGFPGVSERIEVHPRLFHGISHLENNTLVLESIAKTLMDSSQVTEDPFVPPASGAAQITCSTPWQGQEFLLFSTLNTSAIVSPFFSSFQSISKISVSFNAPSVSTHVVCITYPWRFGYHCHSLSSTYSPQGGA